MEHERDTDSAEISRRARFGTLPERITIEQMVEVKPASVSGATAYDPEASWMFMSCLAVDLGL